MGRPRAFDTPEELWKKFEEYCDWVRENPFEVVRYKTSSDGDKEYEEKKTEHKMRAMTIGGFAIFAGITQRTFHDYATQDKFSHICAHVKDVIYEQKFTGAAAELLNPSIIARDLGLADQRKTDHTSSDGSMSPPAVDLSQLTQEQLEQLRNIATACKPGSDQR